MMRHSMAFFCPILRFGVMLFLSFSFCLASGEEYGGRTIDVHGESVPSSRDMKKADAVSSFCEEFLEYRYGKDVEPLHYLTFYLYEKNGWKMRKCNRRWSDFMDDSIEIMQNLYFGSMWTDSVREPLPVPAEGLCIIQVITGRPNMVRTAFKLAHPRLRIPQCVSNTLHHVHSLSFSDSFDLFANLILSF